MLTNRIGELGTGCRKIRRNAVRAVQKKVKTVPHSISTCVANLLAVIIPLRLNY